MVDAIYGPAPDDAIEQAPIQVDATEEAPKKRGPGRPRKDPNAPVRPRGRPRGSGKKNLQQDIAQMLLMFNFIFGFMPEPWNNDAFTEQEIEALSTALNAYAQDHARVYKYLSSMMVGGSMSTVQLVLVIGNIASRRLENHGTSIYRLLGMDRDTTTEAQDGSTQYAEPIPAI